MAKRRAKVGKQTGSIVGFDNTDAEGNDVVNMTVNLNNIYVHPLSNSRKADSLAYSDDKINALAKQIKATDGLLNPILISAIHPAEETDYKDYVLVAGYRRIMALQKLAEDSDDPDWVQKIPARLVKATNHVAYYITQGIENMRENLTTLETAELIQNIIEESNGTMTQKTVAESFGIGQSTVSKYLSLLELPDPIQDLINKGQLSFSNACLLTSDDFEIDESNLSKVAKLGTKYTHEVFKDMLKKNYGKEKEDEDSSSSTSAKKGSKMVGKNTIQKVYVPYLKSKISELTEDEEKELEKAFTAADIQKARLDLINAMFEEGSEFAKEIKPYEEEMKRKEESEKKKESAKKSFERFINNQAKKVKKLIDMPVDDEGNRPYPNVTKAVLKVQQDLKALKESEIEKLGFRFDVEKLDDYTKMILKKYKDNRAAAKKRAAEAKKKKEEKKREEEKNKEEGNKES
jgi:ParB family chromosome partitioning protein